MHERKISKQAAQETREAETTQQTREKACTGENTSSRDTVRGDAEGFGISTAVSRVADAGNDRGLVKMYFFVVFFSKIAYNTIRTTGDHGKPCPPLGREVPQSYYRDMWFALKVVRSRLEHTCILCIAMRACSPNVRYFSNVLVAIRRKTWTTYLI